MFAIHISHLGCLCRQLCPVWGGSPLMWSGCQMQLLFWKPLPAFFQRNGVANTCPSSWCCGSNPILSAISLLLRIFCNHAWGWLICKRVRWTTISEEGRCVHKAMPSTLGQRADVTPSWIQRCEVRLALPRCPQELLPGGSELEGKAAFGYSHQNQGHKDENAGDFFFEPIGLIWFFLKS